MSYQSQDQLTYDAVYQGRVRACTLQQADVYKNDARPAYTALAAEVMKGNIEVMQSFITLDAAGPGIADKVDLGNGSIDQSLVTDADLLSLTQTNWPTVTDLYFAEDGSPIG